MLRRVAHCAVLSWFHFCTTITFLLALASVARSKENTLCEGRSILLCAPRTENGTYGTNCTFTAGFCRKAKTMSLETKVGGRVGSGDTPRSEYSLRELPLRSATISDWGGNTSTGQQMPRPTHLSLRLVSHNTPTDNMDEVSGRAPEFEKKQGRIQMYSLQSNDPGSVKRTMREVEEDINTFISKHNTVSIFPTQGLTSAERTRPTFSPMVDTDNLSEEGTKKHSNLKLLALLVLIIPLALLIYSVWRLYKYLRYKRMVRSVNLSGGRETGEPGDQHMSYLLRDEGSSTDRVSIDGGQSSVIFLSRGDTDPVAASVKGLTEFDPLATTAAEQKAFRHHSETTTQTFSPPEPQVASILNTSNTKTFDGNGDDTCTYDDHWENKHGGQIYATSLAQQLLPYLEGAKPTATVPASVTAVAPNEPTFRSKIDPQVYNATTKVLIDKYANPRSGDDMEDASGRGEGRIAQLRRRESVTFDSIISASSKPALTNSACDSKIGMEQPLATDPIVFHSESDKSLVSGSTMKKGDNEA